MSTLVLSAKVNPTLPCVVRTVSIISNPVPLAPDRVCDLRCMLGGVFTLSVIVPIAAHAVLTANNNKAMTILTALLSL
jgi:hypothetical protein